MRQMLIQEDVKLVEDKIKSFESNTGCELLVILAKESDPYPAASLRFGIISTFAMALAFSYYLDFHHNFIWPLAMIVVTILMTWLGGIPALKRFALNTSEVQRETLEKAIEQFHVLGTSKVSHKVTAMIFISALEKIVHVLIDEKLKSELTQAELDELVAIMKKHFKDGHMALGLVQSIQSFEEKILKDFGGKVSQIAPGELKDTIIFL